MTDTIRICEIFRSIQGEGPSAGTPASFIRLQGCDVGCHWCDTKYSWDFVVGEGMTAEHACQEALGKGEAPLLVVTGGEPLSQPGVAALIAAGLTHWPRVEVETSGLFPPPVSDPRLGYSVSPKLSGATPRASETWAHVARWLEEPNATFKLVVANEEEIEEAKSLVKSHDIPIARVMLMPESINEMQLRSRTLVVAEACKRDGFRMSPRLHIWLWGAKRGV